MHFAVNTRLLIPDKMDGIGRFTYETLLRISRLHPEVQFTFIFDRAIDFKRFNFPENVHFKVLPPQARHPILWMIWFEWQLKNYLNSQKFDLFISPEGWIPPNLNCKSLAVIHDLNFEHQPEHLIFSHRTFLSHFFPKYARRANRIATVSEFSKNDICETYGIEDAKIDVVYNGVNSEFAPLGEEEKSKVVQQFSKGEDYFIFVGSLHPRKNIAHLMQAFELYKANTGSKHKLLIVGNRKWWPKSMEEIYQNSPVKADILFTGRLKDAELSRVLAAALCLTYLPYFEGFGIPILEAFQSRVPVITSNVTSMPEVSKGAAILCPPKDVKEIAEAMKIVAESKNKRLEMIQKGLERAKHFSWDKTADLLWQSIEKTLN